MPPSRACSENRLPFENHRTMSSAALPPPVRIGDRIGIAALSGRVDPALLSAGAERLRQFGFEPVLAANLRLSGPEGGGDGGLFAGGDEERLDGFHALARDGSIKAIVFARGGHGLLRVMPGIDWSLRPMNSRERIPRRGGKRSCWWNARLAEST